MSHNLQQAEWMIYIDSPMGGTNVTWIPSRNALVSIRKRWERYGFELDDHLGPSTNELRHIGQDSKFDSGSIRVPCGDLNVNDCGCCSSYGYRKRAYGSHSEAERARRRSMPATLEIYECPVLVHVFHLRTSLAAKAIRSPRDVTKK